MYHIIDMASWKPKLARFNTSCCEQVMPVPRISIFALSDTPPKPMYEANISSCIAVAKFECNTSDICSLDSITKYISSSSVINVPIYFYPPCNTPVSGSIFAIYNSTVPTDYLLCDGSPVSRITYSALFSAIGVYYGSGDGLTTFNLPNITNTNNALIQYIIKV